MSAEIGDRPWPGLRQRARGALPYVLLGIALVAVAVLTVERPDSGMPLDPRSPGPLGTKALVDVLEELGADVSISDDLPEAGTSTALLLFDEYDDDQHEQLLAWVEDGGALVVVDSASPLQTDLVDTASLPFVDSSLARECDLPALRHVNRISASGGTVHEAPDGATGCFPRNEGYWLVARPEGEGTVVGLGGAATFTNAALGDQDNGLLGAVLLAPDGQGTVTVLEPPPPGTGDATLFDLVPTAVRLAVVQLLIAFGVFVLWRARRLGRPVTEPQPVEVAGSELIVATGNLLQTSGAASHAITVLREDARGALAERLGLPLTATAEQVADTAAARSGAERDEVLRTLRGQPARSGSEEDRLVEFAQSVERVRQAAGAGPRPQNRS
ncbi:MAG: DUF4350 domain-containing protein [Nitriliruptorales bacterium]|nr:DUF4350 domain-containing protein [Nitriliruptorales bacterium]